MVRRNLPTVRSGRSARTPQCPPARRRRRRRRGTPNKKRRQRSGAPRRRWSTRPASPRRRPNSRGPRGPRGRRPASSGRPPRRQSPVVSVVAQQDQGGRASGGSRGRAGKDAGIRRSSCDFPTGPGTGAARDAGKSDRSRTRRASDARPPRARATSASWQPSAVPEMVQYDNARVFSSLEVLNWVSAFLAAPTSRRRRPTSGRAASAEPSPRGRR